MVTTTSLKVGESLTVGLYFNNNYQLPTTCNLIVFIGGVCVGNLFAQEPEIERVGVYYTIRLSSQDTSKMRGYRDLIVVMDDPDGFGNKKFIVGGILFDRMADEFITTSENQGYNMLIGMTVDESMVSGNVELIEAIKGDKGDKGDSGATLHANLTDKNSEAAFQHVDERINEIPASAGEATYTLLNRRQNLITGTLPNGVNSTLILPSIVAGERNEVILHFKTNAVASPTLVYSGFTPVWLNGRAISMKVNKQYTIVFEQVNGIVKTSFGEY